MFDWNDLHFFIEMTRGDSLSTVAAKLGVSHTTVARRIQALEESLSARLFDKTPTGYRPTAIGRELLKFAEQVETACLSAQELVAGKDLDPAGVVRLSLPDSLASHFLSEHLGEFRESYPDIELEIISQPGTLSMSKREADIAVAYEEPRVGRLVARVLTDFAFRMYAAPAYLRRFPPIRTIEDLRRHEILTSIVVRPGFEFLTERLSDAKPKLRIRGISALLAALEAGAGIGLVPSYMAAKHGKLEAVLPDETKVIRTYWMVMHEDMRHVRRVMAVWDWMKQLVAAHQPRLMGDDVGDSDGVAASARVEAAA